MINCVPQKKKGKHKTKRNETSKSVFKEMWQKCGRMHKVEEELCVCRKARRIININLAATEPRGDKN